MRWIIVKDKKPVIIGILSVVLLALVSYILINELHVNNSMTEEPPVQVPEDPTPPEEEPEEPTDPEEEPDSGEGPNENSDPSEPIWYEETVFELPVIGATGYPSIEQPLYTEPNTEMDPLGTLPAGTSFEILDEQGEWWQVQTAASTGWLRHETAFINLPDVLPSIVYDHTNSYESVFRSSHYDIPGVTGEVLYETRDFNERLDREEYIMPILYSTAEKVAQGQRLALENGETLVMIETFRPQEIQELVRESLTDLASNNAEVRQGITQEPWSMTWFISTGVSNHQRGAALDVSLAQIDVLDEQIIGDYHAPEVVEYTEYQMHTPMQELSVNSVIFERPISSRDQEGWRQLEANPEMTEPAFRLQSYLVEAGFTPLASEWWHFNDVDTIERLGERAGIGDFYVQETRNSVPAAEEISEEEPAS